MLSDSTEAYDRGEKFRHYRHIQSLRAYLLVSQHQPRVEWFLRGDANDWLLRESAGLEATLEVPTPGLTLALKEIFANVKFTTGPLRNVTK